MESWKFYLIYQFIFPPWKYVQGPIQGNLEVGYGVWAARKLHIRIVQKKCFQKISIYT